MRNKLNTAVKICGKEFKNPLIAASGCFGYGRELEEMYSPSVWGGISLSATTLEKRKGNPAPRIAETASGMLNSVGLQNEGIDSLILNTLPSLREYDGVIIANIAGDTAEDMRLCCEKLQDARVDMIELNVSCPNVKQGGIAFGVNPSILEKTVAIVKKSVNIPLIVKLSPNVSDISENAKAAEAGGADVISLINTLQGMAIDPVEKKLVLANKIGGLSGPAIKPVALRMVYAVSKSVSIPIIGMGGIMTGRDVVEFLLAGASAVMIGTANISNPLAGPMILEELKSFMQENFVHDVKEYIDALI